MKKVILLAGAVTIVSAASAQTVLFEAFDGMALGSVIGQTSTNGSAAPRTWSQTVGTSATASAVVTNSTVFAGSQALTVTRNAGTGTAFFSPSVAGAITPSTGLVVSVSSRILVNASPNNNSYFGLELGYSNGTAIGGGLGLLGDGRVLVYFPGSAGLGLFVASTAPNVAQTYQKGAWNELAVTQTFVNATDSVVRYFLNGTQLQLSDGTGVFNAQYTLTGAGAISNGLITTRNVNVGLASSLGASAVYDNYRVEAVPEPATMTALALGAAAMLRRRKNRR